MKKLLLSLTLLTLITLTACHTSIDKFYLLRNPKITEREISPEERIRLSPLELIGYIIDEETNYILSDMSKWDKGEPALFREHMFGVWEGHAFMNTNLYDEVENQWIPEEYLVLDDSEESYSFNLRHAWQYYQYGDTLIFLYSSFQAESYVLFLDMKQPDILYNIVFSYYTKNFYICGPTAPEVPYLTKTDLPINEPENGYMSRLRLYEIMEEYGIDFNMIFYISYSTEDNPMIDFHMDGDYNTFPIYLLSQEEDKFVFKSSWFDYFAGEWGDFDAIYTIEKIGGEWVRTVEFDTDLILIERPIPEWKLGR